MFVQLKKYGLTATNKTRMACLSLFTLPGPDLDRRVLRRLPQWSAVMAHDNHARTTTAPAAKATAAWSYLIGFVLAVVLTVIPFWMVMSGDFSRTVNGVVIAVTAVLRMLVHLVFFLHLDRSSESRWNVNAAAFTVVVIGIIVIGTLWVMHNMNVHMTSSRRCHAAAQGLWFSL